MKRYKTAPKNDCPIARASALVGDMWVLLIVRELLAGPHRFIELQESLIPPNTRFCINSRTLTERLKLLEKEKMLSRKAFKHEKPPHVEYSLTKKGRALSNIISDMKIYGEKYL